MKLPFTIYDLRLAICKKSPPDAVGRRRAGAGGNRKSSIVNRKSERGVALVITLILLSVTLIMAVAFLAISRRERGSVVTSTDTATARLAADAALANAEAQIIANVFATTNPYNYGLLVSTNFINANGFVSGVANPTNVNYDYLAGGGALNQNQFLQNIANLYYLPRAPVFVSTNSLGSNEFRFYLDLNRNGKFEDSGIETNYDNLGNVILDSLGNATTNFQVGDPQWIGVLERPDAPHGPNNKFLSRYAFIAVPADNALDLNYIHNQAVTKTVNPANNSPDGYLRNEGVGSWEINLAAFLADLNTNQWDPPTVFNSLVEPYQYPAVVGRSVAFDDARSLLAYRYNNNYNTLAWVSTLFPNYSLPGPVDIFPFGTAMTGTAVPFYNYNLNNPWPGADNTNHFFALASDLFDTNKSSAAFVNRLNLASATNSTYDRYTFYRMLAQLGTDSSPESGKMNLNYDNLDPRIIHGNIQIAPAALTNFMAWTPIAFFTNAADRMLRLYTTNWFQNDPSNYLATYFGISTNYYHQDSFGNVVTNDPSGLGLTNVPFFGMTNQIPAFGLTNIPVYINGKYVYSSAVQRVLQLAANIYDASTNRYYSPDFAIPMPTLFEPVFSKVPNGTSWNAYITNFVEYVGTGAALTNTPILDLDNPANLNSLQPFSLVYGVPIIVGAKKGFPNFNEFSMESSFQITRKIRLTRQGTNLVTYPPSTYTIDQLFNCSITNLFQAECWNSYFTNYTRPTTIWVADHIQMVLTNDQFPASQLWPTLDITNYTYITTNNWPGIGSSMNAASFLTTNPTNLTSIALPTATYLFNNNYFGYHFHPVGTNTEPTFEINPNGLPQPHWGLLATNNLQVVMIDNLSGRAIDYVQLRGPITSRDLTAEITSISNPAAPALMWYTNPVTSGVLPTVSLPSGVENQLQASKQFVKSYWPGQDQNTVQSQIDGFLAFIGDSPPGYTNAYGNTNLQIQAAYTPTATAVQITTWQANDPLVHYLASDLFDSAKGTVFQDGPKNPLIDIGPNERYQPWGISKQMAAKISPDASAFNLALKDPLVWSSDHWDFPTNKFPTVGWLGRVHRGTPWQTVYLKASNILKPSGTNIWVNWIGNINTNDAINAAPLQDRLLFDVFTTAVSDNATRGQLSVNVAADPNDPAAGLAAWSALFSGVMVLSNNLPDGLQLRTYHTFHSLSNAPSFTAFPINPAGANGASSPLWQMVTNINSTRTNFANLDGANNAFEHVGDILSAKQFTEQSPFLNLSTPSQLTNGISDEMYEWLPQQAMSLLRVSSAPRYVIYCYGQTLKPAPNGIVTGSTQFGMVTNYQVVAETATRAVVQFKQVVVPISVSVLGQTNYSTNYNATIEQFNPLPPD